VNDPVSDLMPENPRVGLGYARARSKELAAELAKRRIESLNIYEPLPFQDEYHKCRAKECLMRKGQQAGGSLSGFVEVARAVTGQDPYDKYPKENGFAVCVGYGEKHIGRVIHRYLFRAGAFKIIRDEITGVWRVFKPWAFDPARPELGGDAHRAKDSKPAPPLIPNRFIDGKISWVKSSANIFDKVEFVTGWTLYIANSSGDPNQCQGFQADLVHIDEDLATPGWYTELIGRLSISNGPLRWTAIPHAETEDMMNLVHRAEDQEGDENPSAVIVSATIFDNPFLSDASRQESIRIWKAAGEDVYRQRALGLLTLDNVKMYPGFDKHRHSAIVDLSEGELEQEKAGMVIRNHAQRIITENKGVPPDDWCRYMVVDPGHTVCCVSFLAIPPPPVGDYAVMYKQLHLRQCNATMFGESVQRATRDQFFEDFIIDAHGGRLTDFGSGVRPQRQYEQQLEQRGIRCRRRGSRFMNGSDDVEGREIILREWLGTRRDGTTKFMYVPEQCENLPLEFERFKKITIRSHGRSVVTDKGNRRGVDGIETCEYAAAHGLRYVKPEVPPKTTSFVERVLAGRKRRAAKTRSQYAMTHGSTYVNLGPQGDV